MTLVASTIPNLVSGVSQQPAPSRLRTSGAEMINGFPTIVSGLMKRPPTEHISNLNTSGLTISSTTAIHAIDRDANEKYILVAGEGDLALYDQFGVQQTVTFPNGKSYLPTTDMWKKLRFVTVADTTFVLNTEQSVGISVVSDTRVNPATRGGVFIRQAVASVAYAVYVNGTLVATTTTQSNTSASTALEGTAEIASDLAADALSKGLVTNPQAIGATFVFDVADGDIVQVDDNFGGRAMTSYTDTVQEFEDLPPSEVEGRLLKIEGNLDDSDGGSYWVSYAAGIWTEDVGYGAKVNFNAATMPHILQKQPDGSFEFKQNTWKGREVGDSDSNPDPTFVGSTINGMFLFKGRLGLLSEENVIMSSVGTFEEFYRTTVIQLLASDVIDIASATGRVSTLYHAAAFSDELVLFSDKQQFRLTSGNTLSAETAGITNSTVFPCSTFVAPVAVGSSAYFVADGATHTLAREIFIDESRETVTGDDIAIQIPSYIPLNIRELAASNTADTFMCLSENETNTLYIYKWYDADNRKIQSSWCKWTFDSSINIYGVAFLDSYLYMVYGVGSEVRMDRLLVGPVIDKTYLLDHQFDEDDVVLDSSDATTFTVTIPFTWAGDNMVFISKATGEPLSYVKVDDDTFTVTGEFTDGFVAGVNYEFRYEYSTQYLREENGDGESAIQDGRLQLRFFSQIYTDTSYFEAHVTQNGETKITTFNGRTLADPDNIIDVIPRDTGEFRFPIFGENEQVKVELVSNQPYRCAFGSIEWTAVYKPKARRT